MRPNPWFFIPVLAALVVGAALGWMIAGVSCVPDGCPVSQTISAVVVGVVVAGGVGVVAVLGIRSMGEHHRAVARGAAPPTAGCEQPSDEG